MTYDDHVNTIGKRIPADSCPYTGLFSDGTVRSTVTVEQCYAKYGQGFRFGACANEYSEGASVVCAGFKRAGLKCA